jgi:hypothetical protein
MCLGLKTVPLQNPRRHFARCLTLNSAGRLDANAGFFARDRLPGPEGDFSDGNATQTRRDRRPQLVVPVMNARCVL